MTVRSRILLIFLITLATGFFSLERWLSLELRPRYYQSFEEPLVDMANILAEIAGQEFNQTPIDLERLQSALAGAYQRRLKANIYGLDKDNVDVRVYITDRSGIVIFDSYLQDVGKDFSQWIDVNRTLQGKYGARSSDFKTNPNQIDDREAHSIAYVAAPIYRKGDLVGVLSVGKPKGNVTQFIKMARKDLIWAVVGISGIVIITVTMLYLWVSRPLYQVANFARRISNGESVVTPNLGDNEIGDVAQAISGMRKALDGKQYVEQFTQTLAHELKSPLTSIKASAELLLEDMSDEQRLKFITTIRNENDRALNLIQRLLELAALENRQGKVSIENVNLQSLLDEIEFSLKPLLFKKNLTLNKQIDSVKTINGERFLIKQALLNVIENAIDFSYENREISLLATTTDDQCRIQIKDNGCGIPDYSRSRVFERFYSLPRPDSQKKSSGLGLCFVKEVMHLHQGSVDIESTANGTSVSLTFPNDV